MTQDAKPPSEPEAPESTELSTEATDPSTEPKRPWWEHLTDGEAAAPQANQVPMGYVRGVGTPTAASEAMHEAAYRDAELRRDAHDEEKRIARKPIEQGGGMMFDNQLTRHAEVPKGYVLLEIVTRKGELTRQQCLADVIVGENTERPNELTLMVVCPRCAAGQKRMQDCQLRINQSRKHFTLVAGLGPAYVEFEGDVYRSAGVITESDRCSCPDCHYTFRISQNKIWPD